jgi:hypothetical protein
MNAKESIKRLKQLYENDTNVAADASIKEACRTAIQALEEIELYQHSMFIISEICVDESKYHITSEDAIKKIRTNIFWSRSFDLR